MNKRKKRKGKEKKLCPIHHRCSQSPPLYSGIPASFCTYGRSSFPCVLRSTGEDAAGEVR